MTAAHRPSRHQRRRAQTGFTLVELLVAMVVSLTLAGALVLLQAKLGQQGARSTDIASRDDQASVGLDMISQDLSGAGFMMGGTQYPCNAIFTYSSTAALYATHHAIDGMYSPASGTTVPYAPLLVTDYPSAGRSDVLAITAAADATRFPRTITSTDNVDPTASNVTPDNTISTGTVHLTDVTGLNQGETALMQFPDSATSTANTKKWSCIRVPLTTVTGASQLVTSVPGATNFPAGGYASFNTTVTNAGFSGGVTNALLMAGRMLSLGSGGAAGSTRQQTIIYYVANNGGSYPVLTRNVYNLADDSLVSSTAVAAGVVTLQVLYGVDSVCVATPGSNTKTSGVTYYANATNVDSIDAWDCVRSVKVWVVTRTLTDDPSTTYSDVSTIPAPTGFTLMTTPAADPGFTSYAVPTSFRKRRYTSQVVDIANRSLCNSNQIQLPWSC